MAGHNRIILLMIHLSGYRVCRIAGYRTRTEKYELLGWDMEPGDCLVFQAMIVHGAAGNASMS